MIVYDPFETVPLSNFTPEVIVATGDIPSDMAESYIRQAVIDFAHRSQVVRRKLWVDLQACVGDYLIEPPKCEQIVSIQRICGGDGCLSFTPIADEPCCAYLPCCGGGVVWFVPPYTINIDPTPVNDVCRALFVDASVAPSRDACEVDRIYYDRFHEAIINGALYRLFLIKGTAWYDPNVALAYKGLYDTSVAAGGVERLMGFQRGRIKLHGARIV